MPIVQMLKPKFKQTKTSQLAEPWCTSRCLFLGIAHTIPRSVSKKRCSGAGAPVAMLFHMLPFKLRLWSPERPL